MKSLLALISGRAVHFISLSTTDVRHWGFSDFYLYNRPVCVLQEKVQLQYRLTFTMGEQEHSESGSLEQFPPVDSWGSL